MNSMKSWCFIRDALGKYKIVEQLQKLEEYDTTTFGHSMRTAQFAVYVGCNVGLSDKELRTLTKATLLHDIGKIFIPKEILTKPDKLTSEEFEIMKTHAELGANYLEELNFNKKIVRIVREHHENFDGTGYPSHKKYDELDKLSRILRIADTFDAMHSERPYKNPVPSRQIYEVFHNDCSHCYDPQLIPYL